MNDFATNQRYGAFGMGQKQKVLGGGTLGLSGQMSQPLYSPVVQQPPLGQALDWNGDIGLKSWLQEGQPATPSSGLADKALADIGLKGTAPEGFKPPDLGDGSMDLKTKLGLGLGIAQTGLNAYLGYQGNKLAKSQLNESKRQFNTNLTMQQGSMRGQLNDRYNTASDPSKLAGSRADYLAQYGLG